MTKAKKGPRLHQHVWGNQPVWTDGSHWIFQCWFIGCEEYGYGVPR